jgi:hypothetical protein
MQMVRILYFLRVNIQKIANFWVFILYIALENAVLNGCKKIMLISSTIISNEHKKVVLFGIISRLFLTCPVRQITHQKNQMENSLQQNSTDLTIQIHSFNCFKKSTGPNFKTSKTHCLS